MSQNPVFYSTRTLPRAGEVTLAATEKGLCLVSLAAPDAVAGWLQKRFPGRELAPDPAAVETAAAELREYLEGSRATFSVPLDLGGTAFQRQVWQAIAEIPYGKTRTYGELAAEVGRPQASRAVGAATGANPLCIVVPCHRVVGASGRLTGYAYGLSLKKALLDLEAGKGGE